MNIVIIISTYNERENISGLIPALQEEFKGIPHRMNILVVDDLSPDGTADAVREFMSRSDNIFLISGKKVGLGRAYGRWYCELVILIFIRNYVQYIGKCFRFVS